ncbi:unnamed protein product [Ceutorhynchus assimilis]|uniref:Uncharacterized protein n=1 Tax=Ceutorhynchus assimilis TaxID=467358 RepID=A0A9N9QJG6_9CUCU|nr:unnamed protein product [Ceutorhynchus assimilis]
MSPKRQPSSLHKICVSLLSKQLIQALSDEDGQFIEDLMIYMSSATYDTLQVLLNEILGHINLDASTRFSCLQVLLREDVKNLEVGIFPRFYWDKILETIHVKGKGLQYLNMKGVWVRDYPQLLSSLIENLKNLKSLIIPHMPDDSVILSVIKLKNLMKLDISGEACYTSQGIKLLKSESIRILDIGSFGKSALCNDSSNDWQLMAEIIENLPNLHILKTYSFTGQALLYLYNKDSNFKTKLTYLHTTDCNKEVFEAIVQTCPFLENLHLNSPQENVVVNLSALKKLHSLKLTKGDNIELKTYLQTSGHQLQALKLNHSKHSSIDLSELCEYCPYITTLECYQMYLKYTNLNVFFMNLQKVQILYCDITDNVIKSLLINAPFLQSISVGCNLQLTDGDMFRLLAECTLENLEELLLSDARFLTAITVELLAENCPKLKLLGSLISWDITQDEVEALRIIIAISNTDLTLWPI